MAFRKCLSFRWICSSIFLQLFWSCFLRKFSESAGIIVRSLFFFVLFQIFAGYLNFFSPHFLMAIEVMLMTFRLEMEIVFKYVARNSLNDFNILISVPIKANWSIQKRFHLRKSLKTNKSLINQKLFQGVPKFSFGLRICHK